MIRYATGVVALGCLLLSADMAAAKVGSVAAVNRQMDGTPPQASRRALSLGEGIVQDELIQTSRQGSGQLLFLDQTTLTVAPNSNLLIDSYVYDAESSDGDIALELTRGALRFIGGRVTKNKTAIVRTPSATIGIRGGMAIIRVLEDGSTKVIMLAGEFVQIGAGSDWSPDAVPDIRLSRPNAGAVVSAGGQAEFIGLVGSQDLADEYASFEGTGDGSSESAADSDATGEGAQSVAAVNSGIAGGENNTPVSTSGEEEPDQEEDFVNTETSEEEVTNTTGSDGSDEQQAALGNLGGDSSSDGDLDFSNSDPDVGAGDPDVGAGDPDVGAGDPDVGAGDPDVGAGDPDVGGSGPVVIAPPVPSGGAVVFDGNEPEPFGSVEAGSLIGTANGRTITIPVAETPDDFVDFSSFSSDPSIDFDFGFANDGNPNTGLFIIDPDAGAEDSVAGPISGIGFSDLDRNFHFAVIDTEDEQTGLVFFGDPGPGFGPLLPSDNGTGDPATQNVVEQFDPVFADLDDDAPEPVFIVSDPGVNIGSPNAGTRMLFADVTIDETANGGVGESDFTLFLASEGFDGGFLTNQQTLFEGELFSSTFDGSNLFFDNLFLTSVSDDNGESVFGPNNDFIVVTNLIDSESTDPRRNGGVERVFGGPEESSEFTAALLQRSPGGGGLVQEALPLFSFSARDRGDNGTLSTGGAVAGIAVCSTGNCGQFQESGGRTSFYSTRGEFGNSVQLSFDETNSLGVGNQNEVGVELRFSDGGESDLGNSDVFSFTNEGVGGNSGFQSAYIDDNRFLTAFSTQESDGQVVAGNVRDGAVSFQFASSGLAGDGDFAAYQQLDVDTEPEFARWGWWGTTIASTEESGAAREDAVHLGTWVSGVRPFESDIPNSTVVAYDGVAVGTEVGIRARPVAGRFDLTYDFGTDEGQFNLNIGSVQASTRVVGSETRTTFSGAGRTANSVTQVTGGFFSGGGNPVAATGGEFQHDVTQEGNLVRRTVGIFAGDAR